MRNEFTAIIERDGDWYIAYCPEVPGANGQGRTSDETRASLAEAIALILEDRRVRVLRLGSSQDFFGQVAPGRRAWEVAQRILAEATGEPVETVVRLAWPDETLPDLVEGWIAKYEPDVVCLCISSFWVEAETVAKRFSGLGWVGRAIQRAGNAASSRRSLGANPVYRAVRNAALQTIGGSPAFIARTAMPNLEATIRAVLRHEAIALGVAGSPFSAAVWAAKRRREHAIRRRAELFAALGEFCERLHVCYELPGLTPNSFSQEFRNRDSGHFNDRGHALMGESDGRLMVRAWEQARR